jgi:hypothetical protein
MVHQVLWVDLLTKQEFEAGFGSHTPIYSGQTKCVRYYMNFERALAVFKEVLLRDGRGFDAHNIAGAPPAAWPPDKLCSSRPALACWPESTHMHAVGYTATCTAMATSGISAMFSLLCML